MDNKNQIKWGMALSYVAIAVNIVAGIVYTPWMIRVIGQADYGIYGVATSVIAMFTMDFGLSSAITRFVAKYQAVKDEEKTAQFLGIALKLYLVIDICIAVVLSVVLLLLQNIYISFTLEELHKLRVVFIIIGAFTLFTFPTQIFNGVITAREQFVFQKMVDVINKILIVFFMVIALNAGGGLYALVIVNAIVSCFTSLLKVVFLKKKGLWSIQFKYWEWRMVKEIFSFSIWTTLILILQRFILNISPTILGITTGTEQISVFTAATTIEGYTYTFSGALAGFFMTRVTNMYYGNEADGKKVEILLIRIGRLQLFLIGAICSVFFSMGKEFVLLWLGESFGEAYYVAILLIAPMIVMSTQGIADTALTAKGEIKYRTIGLSVTACISIIASYAFSLRYGAIGSGIGIFIGYVLGAIVIQNIIYKKVLKVNIWNFFKKCHLSMCRPIVITYVCGMLLRNVYFANGWIFFAIKCGVLMLIYFLAMWKLSLGEEERKLLLSSIQKVIKLGRKND